MPLSASILTPIHLPEEVEVEVKDSIRGTTTVVTVDFHAALREVGDIGVVNLQELDPAELITMACAVAKHRAMDHYLESLGIDPHERLRQLHQLDGHGPPAGEGG